MTHSLLVLWWANILAIRIYTIVCFYYYYQPLCVFFSHYFVELLLLPPRTHFSGTVKLEQHLLSPEDHCAASLECLVLDTAVAQGGEMIHSFIFSCLQFHKSSWKSKQWIKYSRFYSKACNESSFLSRWCSWKWLSVHLCQYILVNF